MPPAVAQTTSRVQTTSRAPIADREPSESRIFPLPSPDLTGRSPSEQAVIVALQAVAIYPGSSDFVRAVQQRVPGLAEYLQAAAQSSGCESPAMPTGASPMEADVRMGDNRALPSSSSDEAGRKRVTQEITASTSADSKTESPTSRPPPNKQQADASKPTLKSVVIARPQFRVGHIGVGAPQLSMKEAVKRYGDPETNSDTSPVSSAQ